MPRKKDPAVEQYLEHSGIKDIFKKRTINDPIAMRHTDVVPDEDLSIPEQMAYEAAFGPPQSSRSKRQIKARESGDPKNELKLYREEIEVSNQAYDNLQRRALELKRAQKGGHHSAPNGSFLDKRIKRHNVKGN